MPYPIKIYEYDNGKIKIKYRDVRSERGTMKDLLATGCYFNTLEKFFGNLDFTGGTMIDIGSNIGVVSVYAAIYKKFSKVLSYEPLPENYRLLIDNIKLNNVENVVYSFNMAVGDHNGTIKLGYNKVSFVSASIYMFNPDGTTQKGYPYVAEVKLIDIKDIIDGVNHIDFLKLDCEGSEYPILSRITNEDFKKVDNIVTEFHFKSSTKYFMNSHKVDEMYNFITRFEFLGFKCFIEENQLDIQNVMTATVYAHKIR